MTTATDETKAPRTRTGNSEAADPPHPPPADERPPPENLVAAIARVMGELPGIGKDGTAAASQGGYAYRGIEAITAHAQGLFAKYEVVFVPKVVTWEIIDIVVQGKPWTDTRMMIEYEVHHGGSDDTITVGPFLALGRDNSDKGANKCMTQAFKYALLQVLCISDKKDDSDGQTHEADAGYDDQRPWHEQAGYIDDDEVTAVNAPLSETLRKVTGNAGKARLRAWFKDQGYPAVKLPVIKEHAPVLAAMLAEILAAELEASQPDETPPAAPPVADPPAPDAQEATPGQTAKDASALASMLGHIPETEQKRITDEVLALPIEHVSAELGRVNLRSTGKMNDLRQRLVIHRIQEWVKANPVEPAAGAS